MSQVSLIIATPLSYSSSTAPTVTISSTTKNQPADIINSSTLINISVSDLKESQRVHNDLGIYFYYILFGIGSCGNFYALKDLVKARQLSQYINLLMAHLAFADLCVIFISLPIEIMWRITVSWEAGDISCRFLQIIRIFGMYLSSNIVVCISIDRLHAFTRTSIKTDYRRYSKKFLQSAYLISLLLSIPQAIIYRVENHPLIPEYAQCIQAAWFINTVLEKLYIAMCLLGIYFGPLIAIVFCYCKIFFHLHFDGQSIQFQDSLCALQTIGLARDANKDVRLVRVQHQAKRYSIIQKAKRRTLKMTLIIVIAYLVCWSPYAALILYYSYDSNAALDIDPAIQEGILLFAVSHSCVNPFVYRINLVRRFPSN